MDSDEPGTCDHEVVRLWKNGNAFGSKCKNCQAPLHYETYSLKKPTDKMVRDLERAGLIMAFKGYCYVWERR